MKSGLRPNGQPPGGTCFFPFDPIAWSTDDERKWRLDQEKTCRRRMTGRYLLFLDVISGSQINTRYERKCQCEPDDIHKREGRPAKEVLSS